MKQLFNKTKSLKPIYLFLALSMCSISLIYSSCKAPKEISELTKEDLRFRMVKGGCFGKCPMYKIEIYEGGYTKFFGDKYSDKLGVFDKTISKETFKNLVNAFEKGNFIDFKDEYESNVPDAPSVKMFYKSKDEVKKTVIGKLDRPQELKDLQVMLEGIVYSDGWNLLEKPKEPEVDENAEKEQAKVIKTEIIIEPKPNIALSRWFTEKKELYGIRIIKKIAPNQNLWLITYDTKKVDADMLMQILHNDQNILNAEFNTKTSLRGGR